MLVGKGAIYKSKEKRGHYAQHAISARDERGARLSAGVPWYRGQSVDEAA